MYVCMHVWQYQTLSYNRKWWTSATLDAWSCSMSTWTRQSGPASTLLLPEMWRGGTYYTIPRYIMLIYLSLQIASSKYTHCIPNHSVQNAEPTKLQQVDTRPHYIVRRFAEYSSSIMQLDDKRNTPQVIQALANMRDEGECVKGLQMIALYAVI